ncbi:MAG: energy-coupling factor transporter ATPase [Lachnospiraceae bacterium]|nr:energy-coupling factor transporter ATPase [Lachnospiraceae bacterium]
MSLKLEHVSYIYGADTQLPVRALDDICLEIPDGQFIGLIGHTGSGKSTLVQHLNGLIEPTEGIISYNGRNVWEKDYPKKQLRSDVGLVFQYPEHQLFEVDVFSDVCFGPKNLGLDKAEIESRAHRALELVGFPKEFYKRSPFELSGGQKRRVAIAGVLAMQPKILVLDEPTAGLDPKGRDEILGQIAHLKKETGISVVLVSHSMEDVANYVERIIVMSKGKVMFDDTPREVFGHVEELEAIGLAAPQVTYILHRLQKEGFAVDTQATTIEEARDTILKAMRKQNGC